MSINSSLEFKSLYDRFGKPVMTFHDADSEVNFHQRDFEKELAQGISVPPLMRDDYEGDKIVYPPSLCSDEEKEKVYLLFKKAVKEIYFPDQLENNGYTLSDTLSDTLSK